MRLCLIRLPRELTLTPSELRSPAGPFPLLLVSLPISSEVRNNSQRDREEVKEKEEASPLFRWLADSQGRGTVIRN